MNAPRSPTARAHAAILVLGLFAPACRTSTTSLVVVVDTDLSTPGGLDHVTVTAAGPTDGGGAATTGDLHTGSPSRPWSVVLSPRDANDTAVTVTVVGTLGPTTVVTSVVQTHYAPGEARVLHVFLSSRCANVTCADARLSCDEGVCVPISDVPTRALPAWDGGVGAPSPVASPVACDPPWTPVPSAGTTGVPPDTTLTDMGDVTLGADMDYAILADTHVHGDVTIAAAHATIRRCRIDGAIQVISSPMNASAGGVLVEDSELGPATGILPDGSLGDGYVLRRCNVHGYNRALSLGSFNRVVDSYVHDVGLVAMMPGTVYGIFSNGGISTAVCHSVIENPAGSGEALFFDNALGEIRGLDLGYNAVDGGLYGLLIAPPGSAPHPVHDVHVVGNRFGRLFYRMTGANGPITGFVGSTGDASGTVWQDNVDADGNSVQP